MDPARRSAPWAAPDSQHVVFPPDRCPSHSDDHVVDSIIIPGHRGTYPHFTARVAPLLADSGLIKGAVDGAHAFLVRIHSECMTGEVFSSQRCDCGIQLEVSLQTIEMEGSGVLIYLRQEGRGIGLLNKLRAYRLQDGGLDTVEANLHLGFGADQRDYAVAVAILEDLGISTIRLLTNNPAKIAAFDRSSIRVVARVPLVAPVTDHNRGYLEVKRLRLGHFLEEAER